jgi:hypothetical protein
VLTGQEFIFEAYCALPYYDTVRVLTLLFFIYRTTIEKKALKGMRLGRGLLLMVCQENYEVLYSTVDIAGF